MILALQILTAAGALLALFSFIGAVLSRDQYGEAFWAYMAGLGFVVAVLCGFAVFVFRGVQ